jgi:hypothetical protein
MTTHDKIRSLLNRLPHHLQTRFAYLCCIDIKDQIKSESDLEALALVKDWLDGKTVSLKELCAAANAAYAANAANAAAYAAYAAYAAANAANAAAYAAYAAYAAATSITREKKLKQYLNMLQTMIKDMTELEKILYDLNQEEL